MDDNKLRQIIKKGVINIIKSDYNNSYMDNIEEINSKLFKIFGKGEEKRAILLDVLVEIYLENFKTYDGDEIFLHNLIEFDDGKGVNPKLILPYILDGKFDIKELGLSFLFKLFFLTKNDKLLLDIINLGFEPHYIVLHLIKGAVKYKSLLSDETYLSKIKNLIHDLDYTDFLELLSIIDRKDKLMELPPPILDMIINKNDNMSYVTQSMIWNHIGRKYIFMFKKLDGKDFVPVGSPLFGIILVRDKKTQLFGYVNKEGTLIIPTVFNEISGLKNDKITGEVYTDKGDMKAGYYIMDKEGKILDYVKN